MREVKVTGFFHAVIVDGSFVTNQDDPNDIDLILVLLQTHDFAANLRPFEYNVLSKSRILGDFGFDVLIASENSKELDKYIEFFSRVRSRTGVKKGLVRISL
jgi:hypothetical protein